MSDRSTPDYKAQILALEDEIDRLGTKLSVMEMKLVNLERTQLGGAVVQEIAVLLLKRVKNLSAKEQNDVRFAVKRMQDGASLKPQLKRLMPDLDI